MAIGARELLRSVGARELAQLATPAGGPLIAPELLAALIAGTDPGAATPVQVAETQAALEGTVMPAIALANATIGRIGAGRLLSTDEQTLLDGYACDLARYRLHDDADLSEDHPVRRRFEAAVRFIERVAAGTETLGKTPLGTPGDAQWAELPNTHAAAPVFTRETLADY